MKKCVALVAVGVLLAGLVQAQTVNPKAKVDPKNNKVSRPVVEKPKKVLLTRDQLRHCMTAVDANEAEGLAIKAEDAKLNSERTELAAEKDRLTKQGAELTATADGIKAERDDILKYGEEVKAKAKELSRSEVKAMQETYQARATALDARIDAFNKVKDAYFEASKGFDAKAEAYNKRKDGLSTRLEEHTDKLNEWKLECSNKDYDEADEIAIKKELAAAKAAGK
ncbi:hypothetical protein ACG0Z6_16165 [Roseateles sp. BYS180W]|uniref:Chromosome partition protein Smc n=1 Tax=Roseateles rivi TaxID=3299028 RepID=A0ABW7FZN9_9BURK